MPIALALVLALTAGPDLGAHISSAWPAGGLGRFHSSAAMLGATGGWTTGRFRVAAGYDYASLPGRAAQPYQLLLHLGRAEFGFALVNRPGWDFGLLAGGGLAHGTRRFGSGSESGLNPCAHWGLGFAQRAGPSRVSVGFIHTLFPAGVAGRNPGFDHLLSLRAGVGYAP